MSEAKQRFGGGGEMKTGTIQLLLFADDLMISRDWDSWQWYREWRRR